MKRFVFCVLSFVFTTSAVASAESVKAPSAPRETVASVPDKSQLGLHVPAPVDPLVEARLALRTEVTDQATIDGICDEWAGLAFDIGWPPQEIPKLLRIIYRESRCLPDACSKSDSGRICRDWGLTQINDHSWKSTIRKQGLEMSDMWNPEHNLRFALWLFNYSQDRNGDGWLPWAMQH